MTSKPRLLLSGIDTLEVAYYLRALHGSSFSFEALMIERERLRSSKRRVGTPVTMGDHEFLLAPNGTASGYPLLLTNRACTIQCGEFNNPSFFVTYRSEALWQHGAARLHEEFLAWATALGLIAIRDETVSRADVAFDYHLPVIDFTEDHVVSLSAKDARYRENGVLQTITYGKSDVVFRAYDKVTEIAQQSDKVWLFELWGETENVWRFEWQVRKDVLRRFSIKTVADLMEGIGDLLRYLAIEHDSLRLPTADSNRSRWPLHPLWLDLLEHIQSFSAQGVYRSIDPGLALRERLQRIAISMYGNLKRVAAIDAYQRSEESVSLKETLALFSSLIEGVHEPLSWSQDVAAKRLDVEFGN